MQRTGSLQQDSIWRSLNSRHYGQLRRVLRVRRTTVTIEPTGRGPRQHKNRRFTIPIPHFLSEHILVKAG
jgi:hypothetical protein